MPPAIGTWAVAWLFGGLVLGSLSIVAVGGELDGDLSIVELAAAAAAGWFAFAVAMTWVSRRHGTGDPVRDLALAVRPIDVIGVPLGVVGQLALVPAVYAPLQRIWPETFSDARLEERAQDLADRAAGGSTWLLVLVVVVGAPLVEELVYRGLLQRSVTNRLGPIGALVAVSALFSLVHLSPVEYPGLFAAGLVFGGCVVATGRLGPAIVTHAAFNATGLIAVLT